MRPTYFRRLVQIGSFLRKEAIDVVHQPRLLLTLVIGPFAILAVFGIGYRDTPKPMRTLFVAPPGSPLLELHTDDPARLDAALAALSGAFTIGPGPASPPPLVRYTRSRPSGSASSARRAANRAADGWARYQVGVNTSSESCR